jgi:hypothetical protein
MEVEVFLCPDLKKKQRPTMNHIRQQAKSNEEGKSYLSNGNQASYTHWGAL